MAKEILKKIIFEKFGLEQFKMFFALKNPKFKPTNDNLQYFVKEGENFEDGEKLGEVSLEDGNILFCAFRFTEKLSERSGKKSQYNLGKRILKDANFQRFNAGIFIFYDKDNKFRFSLIYDIPKGNGHRDWNNFRRFTYFVSPDPDQTNKTFLQQIGGGDFSSLEKIKEAFSVEKVTKEFFRELSNWYAWALDNVQFPKDAEKEKKDQKGRKIALIRFLTRIIFIWFMKQEKLVPDYLFDKSKLKYILKDFNSQGEESTYYKAILQNLFFATLSTKKEDRRIVKEAKWFGKGIGGTKDFNNQYAYGYRYLFRDQNEKYIVNLFKQIPFINGGLFERLDDGKKDYYVDGFTERSKKYQPIFPNKLLFLPEDNNEQPDLNNYYGTEKKKYKVEGLINILKRYNFTIDENTPTDVDIALDPELLGKVFENLLASYNPETAITARKATGSYYTPREIVDYMVDESLKSYFKTKLSDIKEIDDKLEDLFSYSNTEHKFSEKEVERIIKAIDEIRVLDPAVGSGAFPMGILQRLVYLLSKLDPDNKIWKEIQKEKVLKMVDETFEKTKSKKEREIRLKELNEIFSQNTSDYGRKLYLIKNCIYGVDIQSIAIQITKLRFFISLLVDMKVRDSESNHGIKPLPNLDFKFVVANSLIPAPETPQKGTLFQDEFFGKLQNYIEKYFYLSDHKKKNRLRKEIEKLIDGRVEIEIRRIKSYTLEGETTRGTKIKKVNKGAKDEKERLISLWKSYKNIFSHNEPVGFFEIPYFFPNIKEGFDIVIGNPPYVKKENLDSKTIQDLEEYYTEKTNGKIKHWSDDLYVHFIFRGFEMIRNEGILSYITNDSFISLKSKLRVRSLLLKNKLLRLIRCPAETFQATIYTAVFVLQKSLPNNDYHYRSGYFSYPDFQYHNLGVIPYEVIHTLPDNRLIFPYPLLPIYEKLAKLPKLKEYLRVLDTGIDSGNVRNKIFFESKIKNNLYRLLQGRQIERYGIFWSGAEAKYKYCDIYYKPKHKKGVGRKGSTSKLKEYWHFRGKIENHHQPERLLMRQSDDDLVVAYQNESEMGRFYTDNTLFTILPINNKISLKYAMALLNSKLLNAIYHFLSQEEGKTLAQIKIGLVNELPFILGDQKPFIELVEKILSLTKSEDYLQNLSKQAEVKEYERQIDQLVYKLYGLTPEEVKIVENYE